jgi:hypothetical protein
MRYDKIVSYIDKGEEGLTQLLTDCADAINEVEKYKDMFREDAFATGDEYKQALNILTGQYMFFEPIFNVLQAVKEIEEDKAYSALRVEAETGGKKMTADALKIEAHKSVGLIIRTRNIFESYVRSCEKAIITVQSQLNRLENNNKHKPVE